MPGVGGVGGWLDTDNKTISVQLNLTGTATGTELGNNEILKSVHSLSLHKLSCACFLLHLLFSTKN